jgi:hypothetical protein
MRATSKTAAVILIGCLFWQTSGNAFGGPLVPAQPAQTNEGQGQAELFGPGAEVKLRLINGKKLDGTVGAMSAEFFDLIHDRDRPPLKIRYFTVKEFEVRKVTFATDDSTSFQHARRVIEGSQGQRIRLKVSSGKSYQGSISRTREEQFELLPDGKAVPVNIAFADIRELKPKHAVPPKTNTGHRRSDKKFLISFGVVYALLLISGSKSSGGLP